MVCAWCMPGNTVLLLYPELGHNVRLSHGICPDCLAEQREILARNKVKKIAIVLTLIR